MLLKILLQSSISSTHHLHQFLGQIDHAEAHASSVRLFGNPSAANGMWSRIFGRLFSEYEDCIVVSETNKEKKYTSLLPCQSMTAYLTEGTARHQSLGKAALGFLVAMWGTGAVTGQLQRKQQVFHIDMKELSAYQLPKPLQLQTAAATAVAAAADLSAIDSREDLQEALDSAMRKLSCPPISHQLDLQVDTTKAAYDKAMFIRESYQQARSMRRLNEAQLHRFLLTCLRDISCIC